MRRDFVDLGASNTWNRLFDFQAFRRDLLCSWWLWDRDHEPERCLNCLRLRNLEAERRDGNPFTRPMEPR